MQTLNYTFQTDGIAVITLDRADSSTNLIDQLFVTELSATVNQLQSQDNLKGVIFVSAKKTFVAGGDLKMLSQVTDANAHEAFDLLDSFKRSLRELETLAKPVVALMAGSALGGGLELALACHQRIAVADSSSRFGLPEVTLGLLPAAGGVSRMTRLLGLEQALPLLTEGRLLAAEKALSLGIIDQIAETAEQGFALACDWINSNQDAQAPWDTKGYKMPGGLPNSPKVAQMLSIAPAMIRAKTQGCYPAANAILATAVEGAALSIEAAGRIETRYFMPLVKGSVAKSLINTLFFGKNRLEQQARNAEGAELTHVAVIGAGMMGAGIAWACASKGLHVVLLDTELQRAEKGKAYSAELIQQRVQRGRLSADQGTAILERIKTSEAFVDIADCDLVIEAVFEDRQLKADVYHQIQSVVKPGTLIASNTSTLPISTLANSVESPQHFIGLHFFSPVDKMPLLEIILGEHTAATTRQTALAFAGRIGKTPIVVNDGRGFFTSRVFKMFPYEGMAMLAEGIPAAAIENAAWLAGYPVGPLAVSDEVTLTLMERIRRQTQADLSQAGEPYRAHPGDAVIDRMLEFNRVSKASGAGFYEYPKGAKKTLWQDLAQHFGGEQPVDLELLKDRFLFAQVIEALKAEQDGIVRSDVEANVGSILGFGFPAWTGGVLNFIDVYGRDAFIARADYLAEQYGDRFLLPQEWITGEKV